MQISDQAEGDHNGDAVSVGGGVRNLLHEAKRSDELGDHGFADPAQGQADDGDAELNAVDDFVEVLMEALNGTGADAPRLDELLNSRVANADQGEFGRREKRIRRHQEKDQ